VPELAAPIYVRRARHCQLPGQHGERVDRAEERDVVDEVTERIEQQATTVGDRAPCTLDDRPFVALVRVDPVRLLLGFPQRLAEVLLDAAVEVPHVLGLEWPRTEERLGDETLLDPCDRRTRAHELTPARQPA